MGATISFPPIDDEILWHDDGRATSLMLKVGNFFALGRLQLWMGGVITTMCGIGECAMMAATQQCPQEGCWLKTDRVTVVVVRFFRVSYGHGFLGGHDLFEC